MKKILFLIFMVLLLRVPTYTGSVIEHDEAYHSMRANAIVSGLKLYVDIVDRKPPLIPYIYASIFRVFGKSNLLPVHILAALWVLGTVFVIYLIGERHLAGKGFWSAFLYIIVSHSYLAKEFYAANIELFMLLPLVLSVYFYLEDKQFLAGLLCGIAFLFKQQGGINLPLFFLFSLISSPRHFVFHFFKTAAGFLIPFFFILWLLGDTRKDFFHWVFLSNVYYISQPCPASYLIKRFFLITGAIAFSSAIIWFSGLREMVRSVGGFLRNKKADVRLFLSLWFLLSVIPVMAGFRFFGHYYMLLLPSLSLLSSFAFPQIWRKEIAAGMLIPLLGFWIAAFFPRSIVGEPDYRKVCDYIKSHTRESDFIFVWGNFAEIYWCTKRNSATRLYNAGFITGIGGGRPPDVGEGTYPGAMKILMEDFEKHPPEFIIDIAPAKIRDQQYHPLERYPELFSYIQKNYFLEAVVDKIHLYRRKK